MGTDIYSQAGSAILSFVNGEGTFEVEGSKLTVQVPGGMDRGKQGELGNIIGQLKPRKFRVAIERMESRSRLWIHRFRHWKIS